MPIQNSLRAYYTVFEVRPPDELLGAAGLEVPTPETVVRIEEEASTKEGFKRVGLTDGEQLVDILAAEYEQLSEEVREKLGLRRVLVAD